MAKNAKGAKPRNGAVGRRGNAGRLVWPVFKWLLVAGIWAGVAVAGVVAWYAADLPDIDEALAATRRPSLTVLAADGRELATIGDVYGRPVRVADLPPILPAAVLAVEDRRFYAHPGIDPLGLLRAALANLKAGGVVQGGSTITQQVAKNLFLTPERTLGRKVRELLLAFWLERRFSKDEILAIYLNRAYLGAGTYGVDAAARKYFSRPASRVSVYQAALLAGLLKAPSRDNPLASPDRATARARQVLASMVSAGVLTDAEAKAAWTDRAASPANPVAAHGGRYFADWVLAHVPEFVTPEDRDLVVATTLDTRLQRLAERWVETVLADQGPTARVNQAALVAMSPDGAVRAMVGGRRYVKSPFNRAVQARRQPGSVFKPIVFLAGLETGLTPSSMLTDAPVSIDGWEPRNFTGVYRGDVTLRHALANSINTVAVRVSEQAGRRRVIETARRLGITGRLAPTPSLALGAGEVSLIELTAAYASFANGGLGVWPYGIESVRDRRGRVAYTRAGSGPGRVAAPGHAAAITEMLTEAVRVGTARKARLDRPVAGKTGTSQNHRDAWFIGFSADLVTGVWVGNDDGAPMSGVTGGTLPASLWRSFMADAHVGTPVRSLFGDVPYPPPPIPASASTDDGGLWGRLKRLLGGKQPPEFTDGSR